MSKRNIFAVRFGLRLYVVAKIKRGAEEIKKSGGIPHEEVKKRLAKWL